MRKLSPKLLDLLLELLIFFNRLIRRSYYFFEVFQAVTTFYLPYIVAFRGMFGNSDHCPLMLLLMNVSDYYSDLKNSDYTTYFLKALDKRIGISSVGLIIFRYKVKNLYFVFSPIWVYTHNALIRFGE